ncbi:MAG: tyrosine-type recombinase/integrase, partial [Nanoarchaeota archaeon]|nr:tyrosine-type recombinase/integrase [Nanoarchaeota archaeon]
TDMEHGLNVSATSAKGSRSFIRLNTIREKMIFFATRFKEIYEIDNITKITEEEVVLFFSRMRKGEIRRLDGKAYVGVGDYVKGFKAFWHWYQKVSKKGGIEIEDITNDLDSTNPKPKWVYLDEKQVKKLCEVVKPEYRALLMFIFDSGIRSPTELVNVKVSDFFSNFKEVHIREEISKTFGRRIKLMLCSELIKEYVAENKLQQDDYVFPIKPFTVNKYLKRVAKRVFGDVPSQAGQKYSDLTLYDFRHISCCYWLPRYKSESALKYRFGWKKSEKIHYYSELLGMKDTISEEDLLIDVTKTEIEKRLTMAERDNMLLKEQVSNMQEQMQKILGVVNGVYVQVKDDC